MRARRQQVFLFLRKLGLIDIVKAKPLLITVKIFLFFSQCAAVFGQIEPLFIHEKLRLAVSSM